MDKFDTHKFLYTLNHEKKIKNKKILYIDKNNKEIEIKVEKIEISSSPIGCNIYDKNKLKHKIIFLRIKKVFDENNNLIWENTSLNLENSKIIKGY